MKHTLFAFAAILAASTGIASARTNAVDIQKYPDVVAAKVEARGGNRFDFEVTIASPYDSPQRYADAFRVTSPEGVHFGERVLLHDHASEQPFTRELQGVVIPAGVRSVVVQARDQKFGYGGKTVTVALPARPGSAR